MRNTLRKSNEFMTFVADKNLGIAFAEPETYDDKAWDEHLGDCTTYRVVPPVMVRAKEVEIQYALNSFLSEVTGRNLTTRRPSLATRCRSYPTATKQWYGRLP